MGAAAAAVVSPIVGAGAKERGCRTAWGRAAKKTTLLLLDHLLSVDFSSYKTGARPPILLCFS